jgi:hypothetical protein
MPITIDYLSLDTKTTWVEVVIDPKDPGAGSVKLKIKDIPWAKWQSLQIELLAAQQALATCIEHVQREGSDRTASVKYGEALQRVITAQTEMIRWGVCGHDEIVTQQGPVPFESASMTFDGVPYEVAAPSMLLLYSRLGVRPSRPMTFVAEAALAVARVQSGETWPTADERWAAGKS